MTLKPKDTIRRICDDIFLLVLASGDRWLIDHGLWTNLNLCDKVEVA